MCKQTDISKVCIILACLFCNQNSKAPSFTCSIMQISILNYSVFIKTAQHLIVMMLILEVFLPWSCVVNCVVTNGGKMPFWFAWKGPLLFRRSSSITWICNVTNRCSAGHESMNSHSKCTFSCSSWLWEFNWQLKPSITCRNADDN